MTPQGIADDGLGRLPVGQRLAIVLTNDGRFDGRARRIAASMAERGHDVIVTTRSAPGLPEEEALWPTRASGPAAPDPQPAGRAVLRRLPASSENTGGDLPQRAASSLGTQSRRGPSDLRRIGDVVSRTYRQRAATRPALATCDLVHTMGFLALPIGLAARRSGLPQVVYDARDLYADARNIARLPGWARSVFRRVESRWARRADAIVTVNDSVARELDRRLKPRLAPTVVYNCPPLWVRPSNPPDRLREALGLQPTTPIALYHGGFSRERGIEELAAAIVAPGLESVHAVFLGYGDLVDDLRRRASDPAAEDRIHVLPAVPPEELLDWLTTADVAVMAIQPTTLNHRLATPNKLFEAIAAGVPVVASDLPGMRTVVEDPAGPLGVLVDPVSPSALANGIRAIVELPAGERLALRERCLAAARDRWNWESQVGRLVALYGRLTGRPW